MARPDRRLPTPVLSAFFVSGGLILALLAYSASLRAENQRLRERLGEDGIETRGSGDDPERRATPTTPAPSQNAAPPTEEESHPLPLDRLGELTTALRAIQTSDKRVWITVSYGDESAARRAQALGRAFQDAGFSVARSDVARFPIRPGLHFMMADDEPPSYIEDILHALEATGATVVSGRGYRAFYDERKRTDPSWNGFPMDDDQRYVIAVGRD